MLSNIISLSKEVTKSSSLEGDASVKAQLGFNFLEWFKLGNAEAEGNIKGSGAKKVLETFEIKTTKSIFLNEVINIVSNDIKIH